MKIATAEVEERHQDQMKHRSDEGELDEALASPATTAAHLSLPR
jgi:hypothetical protein